MSIDINLDQLTMSIDINFERCIISIDLNWYELRSFRQFQLRSIDNIKAGNSKKKLKKDHFYSNNFKSC